MLGHDSGVWHMAVGCREGAEPFRRRRESQVREIWISLNTGSPSRALSAHATNEAAGTGKVVSEVVADVTRHGSSGSSYAVPTSIRRRYARPPLRKAAAPSAIQSSMYARQFALSSDAEAWPKLGPELKEPETRE